MSALFPLFLLWLNNKPNATAPKAAKKRRAPKWPTPKSPPPMPAFQARKTAPPSADPGSTSTPLAELHANPPTPKPASAIDTAKQKATAAIRKRTTSLLQKHALSINPFAKKAAPATSTALVSDLQKILANHGAKIVMDGLYGPKTASAWSSLAKRNGLPGSISREGPRIAKVVTQTFERLSVPPIP